jgi:hypothetical protein
MGVIGALGRPCRWRGLARKAATLTAAWFGCLEESGHDRARRLAWAGYAEAGLAPLALQIGVQPGLPPRE